MNRNIEDLMPVVSGCFLFRNLPAHVLRSVILPAGIIRTYGKGGIVLAQQEPLRQVGLVLTGELQQIYLFPDGNCIMHAILAPGEIPGLELLYTHTRISPFQIESLTESELFCLPVHLFLNPGSILEPYRLEIMEQLLTAVSNGSVRKDYRMTVLCRKGLRERIMTYLHMQAKKRSTNSFSIPFNREEMASFLSVDRSALSHELSLMQQEGLIRFRKNRFTLL